MPGQSVLAGMLRIIVLIFLASCCPQSAAYRQLYAHLHQRGPQSHSPMQESDYFLVILVNARHLDYSNTVSFFNTVAKHPKDGSRQGDLGHAWIFLKGKNTVIEGGHSGERGVLQARYFDGIMDLNERGDPNPAKYLWQTLYDGYFEKGSGGHVPTYAAKVDLSEQQFEKILAFIRQYPFQDYALTGCQCSTFAAQIAALAGLKVLYKTHMELQPCVWYGNQWICLWKDPDYSTITFGTPDVIEKGLMEAVTEGRAQYALKWYLSSRSKSL
ncbi:MAG: hypothetical protein LW832_07615 [Parachlamydia sp.]|jgi:hypothetical protein|nr:hypothetical protein [Parachlamydia sp.]